MQSLFGVCPYVTAQQVLRGKWSIVILHQLEDGPVRFNELQRRLPAMTHATLAKQLRSLEEYGVIVRTEYPQVPPKVEYALSPLGEEFRPVLAQFEAWGLRCIEHLRGSAPDGAAAEDAPASGAAPSSDAPAWPIAGAPTPALDASAPAPDADAAPPSAPRA